MSDHKELLRHSRNYMIANIATKALAFISIPVYTRLLSIEEYGIVNVFISVITIAPILFTLNTEVAISRYYFDSKNIDDFKAFVGCSVKISSFVFIIMTIISLLFLARLSEQLSFSYILTLSIIPVSFYKITNSIFSQIYNPIMESKKIAIVSSVQSYLAFGLSVIAILLLPSDKYYGYVLGNILAMLILGVYLYKQVKPYYNSSFKKEHVKYLLNYCLPYLPYSLSGVIIAQFGKIFISSDGGFSDAGLYSFASNIALIMLVLINLVHQAWNPYYFRYMNENDYISIDKDYDLIWRVTLLLGIFLSVFSSELGFILGKAEYMSSLSIIPVLVLGYIFYQWAYVYMRNTGYAKKTIWNGIVVVFSGIVNIVLNASLIPIYKDIGAALSFMFSYVVLFVLSWIVNKYILKVYSPRLKNFIVPFVYSSFFFAVVVAFESTCSDLSLFFSLFLKVIFSALAFIVLSFPYRNQFVRLYERIK